MKNPNLESNWLIGAGIDDIQKRLAIFEISSKEVVMMYLHRCYSGCTYTERCYT
ncbi:hypothetical protein [Oceanobacillus senegalensis]|uniref:hypothetical protein n=1 Tax=Oceanobacillus senegalensis TaxID=1936063 RepID=UPI0015C44E57|nr:hypothetical protein [Oceanobacillus senegalensis]